VTRGYRLLTRKETKDPHLQQWKTENEFSFAEDKAQVALTLRKKIEIDPSEPRYALTDSWIGLPL